MEPDTPTRTCVYYLSNIFGPSLKPRDRSTRDLWFLGLLDTLRTLPCQSPTEQTVSPRVGRLFLLVGTLPRCYRDVESTRTTEIKERCEYWRVNLEISCGEEPQGLGIYVDRWTILMNRPSMYRVWIVMGLFWYHQMGFCTEIGGQRKVEELM